MTHDPRRITVGWSTWLGICIAVATVVFVGIHVMPW